MLRILRKKVRPEPKGSFSRPKGLFSRPKSIDLWQLKN